MPLFTSVQTMNLFIEVIEIVGLVLISLSNKTRTSTCSIQVVASNKSVLAYIPTDVMTHQYFI